MSTKVAKFCVFRVPNPLKKREILKCPKIENPKFLRTARIFFGQHEIFLGQHEIFLGQHEIFLGQHEFFSGCIFSMYSQ